MAVKITDLCMSSNDKAENFIRGNEKAPDQRDEPPDPGLRYN